MAGFQDDWCGAEHPGQATFAATTPEVLHDGNVHGWSGVWRPANWGHDDKNGWRFCGFELSQCMQACVAIADAAGGSCEELNVASNGTPAIQTRGMPPTRAVSTSMV
jgi:hypothetical protein